MILIVCVEISLHKWGAIFQISVEQTVIEQNATGRYISKYTGCIESFPFSEGTEALRSKFSKPARPHAVHLKTIWNCQARAHSTSQFPVGTFYPSLGLSWTIGADSQPVDPPECLPHHTIVFHQICGVVQ